MTQRRKDAREARKFILLGISCVFLQFVLPTDVYNRRLNKQIKKMNDVTIASTLPQLVEFIKFSKKSSSQFKSIREEGKHLMETVPSLEPYFRFVNDKVKQQRKKFGLS